MNLLELAATMSTEMCARGTLHPHKSLLSDYSGVDWKFHQSFCQEHYTRNLVYKDENLEMRIICWEAGQKCRVHDHPVQGCLVKVLQGTLQEECFVRGEDDSRDGPLVCTKINELGLGGISYQIGAAGLHRISNNGTERAVTLHIYSPPGYLPEFFDAN